MILQTEFSLPLKPRGIHLVTHEVLRHLPELPETGILNLLIKHTSAALAINENADPDVRRDLRQIFERMVPENAPYYLHTDGARRYAVARPEHTCRAVTHHSRHRRTTQSRHMAGDIPVRVPQLWRVAPYCGHGDWLRLSEKPGEFLFEIGCEYSAPDVGPYLIQRPEPSSGGFVRRVDRCVPDGAECIDQLALAVRFEDICSEGLGVETLDAQLFTGLTAQGFLYALVRVDMPSHGSIPFPGLDVFPFGATLQIESSFGVEQMHMHHRVERFAYPRMTFASGGGSYPAPVSIYDGQKFV